MRRFTDWFRGEETPGHEPGVRHEALNDEIRMDDFRTLNGDETVQGGDLEEANVDEDQSQLSWDELEYDGTDSPAGRVLGDVFANVLGLEPECSDPRFVRWLVGKKDLVVEGTFSDIGDLKLSYRGLSRNGILPYRTFDLGAMTQDDIDLARAEIHGHYDEWRSERRKRLAKRAGALGGVLAGIVALAVGIPLGLKRAGNDIQHSNRPGPGPGPKPRTSWTEIEDTARKIGGGILVWIGDHPFLVIGGVVLYVRSRRG